MRNERLWLPLTIVIALGLTACGENGTGTQSDQAATGEETAAPEENETGLASEERGTQQGMAGGEEVALVAEDSPEHGQYLADEEGRAVYLYHADSRGESKCTGQCAEVWPPVVAETGEPAAQDAAVQEDKLGTIQREDGQQQVTYNGHPLYYYAEDRSPGEATGQGVNNEWALVSVEGEPVESQPLDSEQLEQR